MSIHCVERNTNSDKMGHHRCKPAEIEIVFLSATDAPRLIFLRPRELLRRSHMAVLNIWLSASGIRVVPEQIWKFLLKR